MLAVIAPGALGPGSGAVVFYSDTILANGLYLTADNQTLGRNSIAFASTQVVPEPSSLVIAGAGILVLAAFACRKRLAAIA